MTDWVGQRIVQEEDAVQFGVLGMKWGQSKYVGPTQKDQADAVRAFTAKTGKPPQKGDTIAVVNGRTRNMHIFKVNKVKTVGLIKRQKVYDMTHQATLAIDKEGKAGKPLHTPGKKEQARTISILHSDNAVPDYVGMRTEEAGDAKQYGVKGQQWGVRRSSSQLRSAAKVNPPVKRVAKKGPNGGDMKEVLVNKKTGQAHEINKDGSPGKVVNTTPPKNNIQDNVESSSARYDRLAAQAKEGRAKEMTEVDLKFFNARTEALSKVAKLNEVQPSWIRDTTTKVVQQSAQRQMQSIADNLADKYIGDPLKNALKDKTTETVEQAIQSGAAAALRKKAIDDGIAAIVGSKKS